MTILEKTENADQALQWKDNIPTKYLYSYGIAGERFFREIKDKGRLTGAKCKFCGATYLPPRLYCEECFSELKEWSPIETEGKIYTFTVTHRALDGTILQEPETVALIRFQGVKGGLIHKLGNLGKKHVTIGMTVKPRFKPKPKRVGSILDIEYFEPV